MWFHSHQQLESSLVDEVMSEDARKLETRFITKYPGITQENRSKSWTKIMISDQMNFIKFDQITIISTGMFTS